MGHIGALENSGEYSKSVSSGAFLYFSPFFGSAFSTFESKIRQKFS
jgi:hypothetical protein